MEEAQAVNFIQDSLFNQNINTITLEELEKSFYLYNIEFIIVSHGESLEYFANLANITNKFQLIGNNSVYYFYRYMNATRNFVLSDSPLGYENFRMDSTKIQFNILSYSLNQEVVISLHDYVNWRVYINGVQVEKEENEFGLIQFSLIDYSGQFLNIEIKWEKMMVEYIFNWISSVVFVGFVICFLSMKKRFALSINRMK